jgi:hypothetical protein
VVVVDNDVLMRSMDGFAVARWARKNPPTSEVVLAETPSCECGGLAVRRLSLLAKRYDPQIVLDRRLSVS